MAKLKRASKSPKIKRAHNAKGSPDDELMDGIWDSSDIGAEDEDDLLPLKPETSRAVVTSTDWTTETIVHLFERKTIELDPSFQRREAWTQVRKSRFIESLMMGLPIPQIVLAEKKGKQGQFIVIDGKQRLLALQQFARTPDSNAPALVLGGLKNLKDLNGMTYEQLKGDSRFEDHLEAFRNQPIRAVVVKNWPDENFLYLVFLRLNTGSVPLAPQELRQALHPGPFLVFVNEYSACSDGIQASLRISKPDFRMRDVELMIRYYGFKEFMESYRGNMKSFLDETCEKLNKRWATEDAAIRNTASELEKAIVESKRIFPKGKLFSLCTDSVYEGRFNRTVFDIFTHYLSIPKVRKAIAGKQLRVRKLFEDLCDDDEFRSSLQITTKSLGAVHTRFSVFGEALCRLTRLNLHVPKLVGKRLVVE
ncbi:MAG: DUF262 domain-containing protein [Planctomycetaceae bacterium]